MAHDGDFLGGINYRFDRDLGSNTKVVFKYYYGLSHLLPVTVPSVGFVTENVVLCHVGLSQ